MRGSSARLRIWLSMAVLVVSLLLYLRTLAPTITWEHDGYDAGDLITAAYTLGIPHPTGYPTYVLLGKLFTSLPIGDIAYRMNLLSAVSAAAAMMLLYCTAARLLSRKPYAHLSALCAALLLASSRLLWSQAVITEVYALNCLFFALILHSLLPSLSHAPPGARHGDSFPILGAAALAYGLSLGNHLTMVLTAPLVLCALSALWRRRVLRVRQAACLAVPFLLGLCVYLYLPVRAGVEPLLNWGNPRSISGLIWVVSGGIYRQNVLALPVAQWGARWMAWAALLRQQFGAAGVALGAVGAWKQAQRSRQVFLALLVTLAAYSAYAVGYNTTDSYVYLLPAHFVYALWIAVGAQYLLGLLNTAQDGWAKAVPLLAAAAVLALPLASVAMNLPLVDLSRDRSAYDYAWQAFAQVPDGSLIISVTDAHTFTLWYFSRVVMDHRRVALVDRDLLGYPWYVEGLRRSYGWLRLPSPGADVPALVEANRDASPIFLTDPDSDLMSRYAFRPQGVLYRLQ